MRASDEMLSWLRSTIEGDKALAEVAGNCERYGVRYTGHWTYTPGDDLVYQDGRRGPGVAGIVGRSCACCGPASAGYPHDLMHVATHDPRDTIARCEADLKFLDDLVAVVGDLDEIAYGEGQAARCPGRDGEYIHEAVPYLLKVFAQGFKHRPGFNPEWVSD
ncbi:DUF6221 family protein [Nonomuraea sp. NPDC046802]|uniref:DUF6221 family protein n=1 Tax=Nonomuraea sp. NPDC046802 TaxID=3154919 RepID=UPI0033D8F7CD